VVFAGNSHKVEDVLQAAGSRIPVCRSFVEARKAVRWADKHPHAYDALFDWLERQPRPQLPLPLTAG